MEVVRTTHRRDNKKTHTHTHTHAILASILEIIYLSHMEQLDVDVRMLFKLISKCRQLDDRQLVMFAKSTNKCHYVIKL